MPSASPTIDFHAHVLEPDVFARTFPNSIFGAFGEEPEAAWPEPGSRMALAHRKMLELELRLADMDEHGIDRQVISSPTVQQYTGWAAPELQLELEGAVNDAIGALCRLHSDRLLGSFTLPLRDVALSVAEAERAVRELDLHVANLPASADGIYLGERHFRPLWEAIRDLDIVAFIHPDGVRDPWFRQYALWNSLGQSIEESKAMASLILEGVLEDMPELKIVVAHGGGFPPHYFGRLDRNFRNRPATARNIDRVPSDYLRRFHLDTCVYDPAVLGVLLERVGPERLVLGTDYPVGDADPFAILRLAGVTGDEREAIAGGNALRLLGARDRGTA